jgi:SAM-dependent methyltransferase
LPRHQWLALALLSLLITSAPTAAQQAPVSADGEALGKSWDPAYLTPEFNLDPNAFLVSIAKDLKRGDALDVGMGQGRNAIFLARQGWNVTGFDASQVGVTQAQEQARKSGLNLTAVRQTAAAFDWGTNRWDLIVVMYQTFSLLRGDCQASGPDQSKPMCLLERPVRSHLNPKASALSAVARP